jgi:uncharacterized protein
MDLSVQKKIWIDLDNSPHVPLFRPVIHELEKRGHGVMVTARDCFQVGGLCDLHNLACKKIGRHYGKNKLFKVLGLTLRAMQMMPVVSKEKPDLALSHGSRSQLIVSRLLGLKSIMMDDYEHSTVFPFAYPNYVLTPEVIDMGRYARNGSLKYPGIKEDVYVPSFEPDPSILKQIGIEEENLLIIVRPPATEAHYHKPESETLFIETLGYLSEHEDRDMKAVILPRNNNQGEWIKKVCPGVMSDKRFLIPNEILDGLNLIWFSDLVISGGGTMNREAAALGVPVYSIFRGEIGAVDQYLNKTGRLVLIETVSEIKRRIILSKRLKSERHAQKENEVLTAIVNNIERVME